MGDTYRVLITDDIGADGLALLDAAGDVEYDVVKRPSREKLLEIVDRYDVTITRSGTTLDAEVLEAASRLKIAARAGVGIDNIDLEAATRRGVLVMNTPQANTLAAVELTMALILACCRHLPGAHASVQRGEWTRNRFLGTELNGKTLGVVGLGRIGSRVATRCQAFGMRVIAYDPYIAEDVAERIRVGLVAKLGELLGEADIVTVHTPLNDETRGMIAAAEMATMKPGARLVNCARGGICEEAALYEALVSGRLACAAMDVYSEEPPSSPLLQRLLALENVVATPHIGANTKEAQRDVAVQVVEQVLDALREESFRNVVNLPFIEGVDYRRIAPYMTLAEKMGSLQIQLMRGRIKQVEVEFRGEDVAPYVEPLTVALLKGLLTPILSHSVNFVNAAHLAEERGIRVSQTRHPAAEDYSNVILCRVVSPEETRLVGGALFLRTQPRIVLIDDFRLDALPSGWVLVMSSRDVPGVIGRVGTLLGDHGINIAEWRLGRDQPGEKAISFINIDAQASQRTLSALASLPPVMNVRQVHL